ncbi:toll/interleukin-1 receptor domain-containing protein [Rhodanobacter aciditrophus]|uniref:Toll/interleukin-1 receptor domain-containing protein n=1 Tax=Rhodanobacter aciditrophus TaxID=1623218 RepID=A0ABW4AYE2_9GAMM
MKDVFLSHASPDKENIVRPFAEKLGKQGISYWLDEAEMIWGDKLGKSINAGLEKSNYIIVFISEHFVGRNWAEAELSSALTRENSEGRNVVLPIVIGNPNTVLSSYPLLRDKIYKKWDDGIDSCIESLKDVIFSSKLNKTLDARVYGTVHDVKVNPGLIIELLGKMNSHACYPPEYFLESLTESGLLVKAFPDNKGIVINGKSIPEVTPDFGEAAIWSLDVASCCWEILMKRPFEHQFFGRGKHYRHVVASLRHYLLGVEIAQEFERDGPG